MVLDLPNAIEYGIELGYGVIYVILAITTIRKFNRTGNRLALYFFIAFIVLALTGLYGGIAGILSETGFDWIPIIGNKILEIYEGLALVALGLFVVGLIKT